MIGNTREALKLFKIGVPTLMQGRDLFRVMRVSEIQPLYLHHITEIGWSISKIYQIKT